MLLKAFILCAIIGLTATRPQEYYNDNEDRRNYANDRYYNNAGNNYNSNNEVDDGSSLYYSKQVHDQFNGGQPYDDSRSAYIRQYDFDNEGNGNYVYNVSQSDGIYNDQTGTIVNQGTDNESSRVYGHYGYWGPDKKFYYTEYVADENGFRVAGDHIPPAADVSRVSSNSPTSNERGVKKLGIPSAAIASLAGGGLG